MNSLPEYHPSESYPETIEAAQSVAAQAGAGSHTGALRRRERRIEATIRAKLGVSKRYGSGTPEADVEFADKDLNTLKRRLDETREERTEAESRLRKLREQLESAREDWRASIREGPPTVRRGLTAHLSGPRGGGGHVSQYARPSCCIPSRRSDDGRHTRRPPRGRLPARRLATDVCPAKVPDDLGLLFAGPECQGFSAAGGDIDPGDPRNKHLFTVIGWVAACQPKIVVIENVRGLTELHSPLHEAIVSKLAGAGPGYRVETVKLDAAAYGVPQRRTRVFILGARSDFGAPGQWSPPRVLTTAQPELTDFDGGAPTRGCRTARETIGDLPAPLPSLPPAEDPIHTTVGELRPHVDDDRFARHYADPHSTPGTVTRGGQEVWLPPKHVRTDHDESTRYQMAS